ncbi:hypothetical protein AUI51_02150 [archaeon 13_1_40CM_2_52_4]|nr:MAG: hypothetical protein AUI51_02150 [archaeon 13_1_40CM_2_52_4]
MLFASRSSWKYVQDVNRSDSNDQIDPVNRMITGQIQLFRVILPRIRSLFIYLFTGVHVGGYMPIAQAIRVMLRKAKTPKPS